MDQGTRLESLLGCILGLSAVFLVRILLLVHSSDPVIDQAINRVRRSLSEDFEDVDFENTLEDPWENENSTHSWKTLLEDLAINENTEMAEFSIDGGISKQRSSRRRGPNNQNLNRFREHHISALHKDFKKQYEIRMNNLKFFNEMNGITFGRNKPDTEEEEIFSNKKIVKNFLDSFGCDASGKDLWTKSGGRTNIWTIFPEAVPTFTDPGKNIIEWSYYWKFFEKFSQNWNQKADIRFSVGTYGKQAKFTPRGFRFSQRTPWNKIQRFYRKPQMTAATPKIFPTIRSLLTYIPRYGVSTASVGDNCVVVWFFQDVPQDLNDFMIPEQHDLVKELHSLCTVIPIVVGPDARSDLWKNFLANLVPGLQLNVAKDADYSGQYFVEKLEDLVKDRVIGENGVLEDGLVSKINKFQCLVENRGTCRIVNDAYIMPMDSDQPTEGSIEATEGFRAVLYDDSTTEPAQVDLETTTGGATTQMITTDDPESVKIPEIDSCCGHDSFTSIPFDSELKTCCEDGTVRPYEFDGQDPCAQFQDYFSYEYK